MVAAALGMPVVPISVAGEAVGGAEGAVHLLYLMEVL